MRKQHGVRDGKQFILFLKTPGNAIYQNVPRCLGHQELVPFLQVFKAAYHSLFACYLKTF